MLKRYDHSSHGDGHIVLIGDSNLRLAVCTQPRGLRLQLIQPFADAMCQHDGQGKVFFCFIGGIAHNNALIACTEICCTYGGGDVGRLFVNADFQFQWITGILAEVVHGIAGAINGVCNDSAAVHFRLRGDLAADEHLARRGENLYGDSGVGILPEVCVQNGVRHLIAELVGVTGTDGFRRDQPNVFLVHSASPCQS